MPPFIRIHPSPPPERPDVGLAPQPSLIFARGQDAAPPLGRQTPRPHDWIRGGETALILPVPLCRRNLLLTVARYKEKEQESEEREAGENEMRTFVAFLHLTQSRLIVKPTISGAESRRLIRISLRRRLERRGAQGRTEREGGPAGSHAFVSVSAVA